MTSKVDKNFLSEVLIEITFFFESATTAASVDTTLRNQSNHTNLKTVKYNFILNVVSEISFK